MKTAASKQRASQPRSRTMRRGVAILLSSACAIGLLSGCISQNQQTAQTLLNNDRAANSKPALVDYSPADAKAQAWAEHLAQQGSLSHSTLSDGYASGTWCALGENVGMGPSISAVETGFMNSTPHRTNILGLTYNYNEVGTGVATNTTTGYTFVVQEFVMSC